MRPQAFPVQRRTPARGSSASWLGALVGVFLATICDGGVRDQTRIVPRSQAAVNETQASQVTLTMTDVAVRDIQSWIRTAGKIDSAGKTVVVFVRDPEAQWLALGQRARAFTVNSRTQMLQGKVTRLEPGPGGIRAEITLAAPGRDIGALYLTEIVASRGRYLSVPNAALIEEEDRHVVYRQSGPGQYERRTIKTGIQGELFTEVTEGVAAGDQVVSVGSFFVDADVKLK